MSKRDYAQAKIYCIRNTITDDIYVGSSCEKLLSKRMVHHRRQLNCKNNENRMLYIKMKELGVDSFYIELHHVFPCETHDELLAEEGKWIREIGTLNHRVEKRDKKVYYQDKKEEILEKNKVRYINNCEEIKQKRREYYNDNKKSVAEWSKNYHLQNQEKILQKKYEYYQNNRDDILRRSKEKRVEKNEEHKQIKQTHLEKMLEEHPTRFYKCQCGIILLKNNKNRHLKSQKHQAYLNQQKEN